MIKGHRPYNGELLVDTKHAVEVMFDKVIQPNSESVEQAESDAAIYAMDNIIKSKPYPFKIEMLYPSDGSDVIRVFWTEDDEERLITPKFNYEGDNKEIPDVMWQQYEIGDSVHFESSAPGIGHATFFVTRKDETGLWGICNEDTRWVPDGEFYR